MPKIEIKSKLDEIKYNLLNAIELAYMAGKWAGEAGLEEHYDLEQYGSCLIEAISSRKSCMPHDLPSIDMSKTVRINLRSDKWRTGAWNNAKNEKQEATNIVLNFIEKYKNKFQDNQLKLF